jgi:hypothetical protein
VLIAQAVGKVADKAEQTFATRLDMGAVLDVFVGPVPLGRLVVPLIEKSIERLEQERLFASGWS